MKPKTFYFLVGKNVTRRAKRLTAFQRSPFLYFYNLDVSPLPFQVLCNHQLKLGHHV